MHILKTKLISIASLFALLLSGTLPVEAKPALKGHAVYQRAKKELPKDFYALYRIVDRVARANGYEKTPWRIVVVPQYDINAFATDVNLIAIYDGILDQLGGDSSALACVVSHEMGHHIKRHAAVSLAKKKELMAQIQEETQKEVLGEKRAASQEAAVESVGGEVGRRAIGGRLGNVVGNILGGESQRRHRKSEKRIKRIVEQKTQELEQRIAKQSRKNEFEADKVGYLASVRAGFEPEGCLRVMEVLGRIPGAEFDTDHPAVPKRIEGIKALMVKYPPKDLTAEGKAKLSKTQPLSYELSRDKVSLKVNSIRGGSAGADIDKMFGD